MEVPGVIFLYSIVKYRKEIEEKEGKRERDWRNIPGKKGSSVLIHCTWE